MVKGRRFVPLCERLDELGVVMPEAAIREGHVLVNGRPVLNPNARIPTGASVVIRERARPRGARKLRAALERFEVDVTGRVAVDVGAAAGGFTLALLEAGTARVYAVDVGYGQLLGSLRQHPHVVNLERTNLAELDTELVPNPVDLVVIDVSYISLTDALPQLNRLELDADADLLALVKPMFELGLSRPPDELEVVREAVHHATTGVETAGWTVIDEARSPVAGAGGAVEWFVYGKRSEMH